MLFQRILVSAERLTQATIWIPNLKYLEVLFLPYLDPKPKVLGSNLDRNLCLPKDSSRAAAFYEFTIFLNVRWNVILVVTTVSHGVSERGS